MWDTLLAKLDRDEILAVMGHEMGHYVLLHLWKGMAFGIAVSLAGFFIASDSSSGALRDGAPDGVLPIVVMPQRFRGCSP